MNAGKQRRQHTRSTPSSHTTEQNSTTELGGSREPALEKEAWAGRMRGDLDLTPACPWLLGTRGPGGWSVSPRPLPEHLCSPSRLLGDESLFGVRAAAPSPDTVGPCRVPCSAAGSRGLWGAVGGCGEHRGASPLAASAGCKELTATAALRVRGCQGNFTAELGPKRWGPDLFFSFFPLFFFPRSEHQL